MIKKYKVRVDGKEYEVEVEGVGEGRLAGEKKEGAKEGYKNGGRSAGQTRKTPKTTMANEKTVCAPMPAKVVKINCRAGEEAKKGDLLMIIEAMKMENEIFSPIDGVVKEVCVVEEANVSNEERLVVFE